MKNKSLWILLVFLLLIFAVIRYVQNNMAEIMAARADWYYKKNNIEKAQIYFERAFELGLDNSKQREIYVNLLINSPLTTEAQEKLVKFVQNPKNDVARGKAEYFIYDIRREIYRKYPENYITNTVFNQKIMRWGKLPITYSFENTEKAPAYFREEIKNAFDEWEKVTEHQILFEEVKDSSNIIIKYGLNNPADSDDRKYAVAYTSPIMTLSRLKNMEIVFYLKDVEGEYFSKNQVYNTALHEIVHALGFMGHSNNSDDLMYITKDAKTVSSDSRENLTEADINTVKLLYKIKPQITNVDDVKSEYIPDLVLGTAQDVKNKKLIEAANYIKRAPNLPAGYIDLAEAYVADKKYEKAVQSLKKALKLADTEQIQNMICYDLAISYFYLGNLKESKNYLQHSMNIQDTEEKHYLLGEIYAKEGNQNAAIKEYENLIVKSPSNIEYIIALTNIYVINRQYLKARKVLKSYVKANPQEKNNARFKPYGILTLGL